MEHLSTYVYKTVRVLTKDGRTLQGKVVSYSNAIENDMDYDEIDIRYSTHLEVVDESEIKEITVLEE